MAFRKKKTSFVIALLFLMTAFIGIQTSSAALEVILFADAGGPYYGEECSSLLFNASGSYDPEGNPLTYRWNIDGSWLENDNYPYNNWTWYDDFSGTITLEVSDGTNIATDTTIVTIANVPPQISSIQGPSDVAVNTEFSISMDFFDGMEDPQEPIASLDTFTARFSWGDASSTELLLDQGEFSASASHTYTEIGIYQIIMTVIDDNGGEAVADWEVVVGDIPLVEVGPDCTVHEGSLFLSAGYLADTESLTYTAIVDYYDGTGAEPLLLNQGNTFELRHTYADDGVYTLLVTVFNDGIEYGFDTANITVNNVAPAIDSLSVSPSNLYQPGIQFECIVMFSDPGVLDTHSMIIDWGDGTSTNAATESGITTVSGSHRYEHAGDYEITVALIDDDGGVDCASMSVVVRNLLPPPEELKGFIAGLQLPKGLKHNLLLLLENVPHLLKHHWVHVVIHQLRAFIHYVEAQSGKRLTEDQAQILIIAARSFIEPLRTR